MGKCGTGKLERICFICKKHFLGRKDRIGKFCSKSCAAKIGKKKVTQVINKCSVCGIEFKVKKYRAISAIFCSVICRRKMMPKRESHVNWKGGISSRPHKVKKVIKELINRYKQCNDCGSINDLQGHHLIPYSERPDLGWDKNNIVILCKFCHSNKHPEIRAFIIKGINNETEKEFY